MKKDSKPTTPKSITPKSKKKKVTKDGFKVECKNKRPAQNYQSWNQKQTGDKRNVPKFKHHESFVNYLYEVHVEQLKSAKKEK